jgi:hypothetical protein
MRRISIVGLMVLIAFSASVPVVSADTGPIQNPLNDHFYEAVLVPGGIAWQEAKTAAESRSLGDVAGHLATFTSAEEYDFVVANLPEAFISTPELQNPYLLGGFQPPGGPNEPDGNWQWVTGEPFVYTNWASGEPNNAGPGAEDCMQIAVGAPQWNDLPCEEHARGYIVEYDVSGTFADDENSIFESDIEWLAAQGITQGCGPALFCPDDLVTRGQMAAFLVRALGYTDNGGGNLFTDDNGSIFEDDIDKLATAGVTQGCGPGLYCPDDKVTRGQMAAFLVRALGYTDNGGGNLFTDDNGSIFEDDIDKLATAGVTQGCGPGLYCPDNFVTRGQMAAFLHRALG